MVQDKLPRVDQRPHRIDEQVLAVFLAGGTALLARSWLATERIKTIEEAKPLALPAPGKSSLSSIGLSITFSIMSLTTAFGLGSVLRFIVLRVSVVLCVSVVNEPREPLTTETPRNH